MKTIEPGCYPGMPFDEYLSIDALSKSGLVKLKKSPAHFKTPDKPRDPKVLEIGQGFHTLTLEGPQKYNKRYAITDLKLSTKAGIAFKEQAKAEGRTIFKQQEHDNIQAMAKAVREHPDAGPLVEGGISELSVFWKDPDYGFLCKLRADKVTDGLITIDLKKCQDAEDQSNGFGSFFKSFISLKYHWQAYWYLTGLTIATETPHDYFAFIAVEEQPPHGVNVFYPHKQLLAWALEEIDPLRLLYAECLEKDQWPCYEPGAKWIELPGWARKQMEAYYD